MNLVIHKKDKANIAELVSDNIVINSREDFNDLLASALLEKSNKIILHDKNIDIAFFDNKSSFNKEVQEQLERNNIRLAIIENYHKYYNCDILKFINNCRRSSQIIFVKSVKAALKRL
jgi:hypothetical protein